MTRRTGARNKTVKKTVKPRKSGLRRFQSRLLELLWNGTEPEAVRDALLKDKDLAEFRAYVREMEPRMLEVAGELVRKWGRGR